MFMFDLEIGHNMRQAAISIYEFTHLLLKNMGNSNPGCKLV